MTTTETTGTTGLATATETTTTTTTSGDGNTTAKTTAATLVAAARRFLGAAWAGSPALMTLAAGATALLAASSLMQVLDARLVGDVSAWLKPAKFAASIVLAAPTLAWIVGALGAGRGPRRAAAVMAAMGALELTIITAQAARGVPSHFNFATPLDGALFQIMGAGITTFWIAEAYVAVRAFRHRFADVALGWGVRLGLVATLLGGAVGFVMPHPTPSQLASLRAGRPTPAIGAHAVGVPDGGPGLPVTHWSTTGGDLRVPHFFGLHGLQVLPLMGFWLARRARRTGRAAAATRTMVAVGAAYVGLTIVTLIQALRAQPLLAPDGATLALAAVVALVALVALPLAFAASAETRARTYAKLFLTRSSSRERGTAPTI
jgi:hypothetical protein